MTYCITDTELFLAIGGVVLVTTFMVFTLCKQFYQDTGNDHDHE